VTLAIATVSVVPNPALAEHARAIHELTKRTCEDIIAIGRHLTEAREFVGHGAWLDWLEVEFGWSDQTARRFIHVYELSRDSKFNTLVELDLPLGVLYQIAAPKAEAVRTEIAERLESGEQPSATMVTEVIAKAKGKTAESADDADHDVGVDDEFVDHDWESDEVIEEPAAEVSDAEFLLGVWNDSTPKDQQFICDLVLEEFFAQASGADFYARIPAARLDEVIPAFLDKLTVEGMRTRMSDLFGQEVRRKLAAPGKAKKSAKPYRHTLNLEANSARSGRVADSR
jgi:hypothetical protein